jgi:6-phosphogluconolactonase
VDDPAAAARAAAEELARAAGGGASIALSGGSTPRRAYELAAMLESRWGKADVWWADERCVRPDDPRSNFRLVRETLVDRLAVPPNVHRVRGEREADEAAALYDEELLGVELDLAVLGIGEDGHTASLFPRSPALEERERRAVATPAGAEPFVDRVTLTVPVLERCRRVLFLVTGESKAEPVARAFRAPPSAETPASLIRGTTTVAILDRAAAGRLSVTQMGDSTDVSAADDF